MNGILMDIHTLPGCTSLDLHLPAILGFTRPKCWLNELSSMLPQDSDGHKAHAELCPTGTVPVQGRQAIDPWIDGFKDA